MTQYICEKCSRNYPLHTIRYFCECGGLFELDFTPPHFSLSLIDQKEWSIFRYRAFFPIKDDSFKNISLGEGMTPIVDFDQNIKLKIDYAMPTLSFKDRGAALLIALCNFLGVKEVIQDSSGNAANSVAAYAARSRIACEIFVPRGTSNKKIAMIEAHGANVTIIDGTRDQTAAACRHKAFSKNIFYASHVYNPFFYQGTKTYIYETFEQLGRLPDNLVIPVGNGTLLIGSMLALEELKAAGLIEKFPKIFAVQSERCAPILKAFEQRTLQPQKVTVTNTRAEGIAVGEPMRGERMLKYIYKYRAAVIPALEETIEGAKKKLAHHGLYVEDTTAASLSALTDYMRKHEVKGDILISLCGAGLKSFKG